MIPDKQNPDFLQLGKAVIRWYHDFGRKLPFRETRDPYKIWICEIIFQQTRIAQGLNHYNNFIARFPDVETLAAASADEVLLYWKGLGYYSRALNVQHAARQVINDFSGRFPEEFEDILSLKGIGKYTAAAISSICFGGRYPAVDGNLYRVLSRLFTDGTDISGTGAFAHFSSLALKMMPPGGAGEFNQAMMDLGSEICRPKQPRCTECPLNFECIAYKLDLQHDFPVKKKKVTVENRQLFYFFVEYSGQFLIKRRETSSIWKNLYEFPVEIPETFDLLKEEVIAHKLTHRNLSVQIRHVRPQTLHGFRKFAAENDFITVSWADSHQKSFPKPLENYLMAFFDEK